MKSALITDFYELTMMQGYFIKKHNPRVVFDVFYRNNHRANNLHGNLLHNNI